MSENEDLEIEAFKGIVGLLLVGTAVGFLIIAALGSILPVICYFIGGTAAGLIAGGGGGGGGRGMVAGFLGGVFGGMMVVDRTLGLVSLMGLLAILCSTMGGLAGGIMGRAIATSRRIKRLG